MNRRQQTIDTYNKSAVALTEYFRGIGPRVSYIELALYIAGQPDNPNIVEIGCGDGRDARAIVERTNNYVGFDVSEELIKLARKHVPDAQFEVADAIKYQFPKNTDVIFAFASILHLDKGELKNLLERVAQSLRKGGVFYISSKYADSYKEYVKDDSFGTRLFYLYNPKEIISLAERNFSVAVSFLETRGKTKWFELGLVRR